MTQRNQSLRITEIFYSLQGESRTVGLPTVFVRLTGCPLRCVYCDTAYAFSGGSQWTLDDIEQEVAGHGAKYVCVTGGEPLAQPNCWPLLRRLCDAGYEVSLETSGAMDTSDVDERVVVVLDLKSPSSGEVQRNLYDNIARLKPQDQVKFVLANRADYEWMRFKLDEYQLCERVADVLVSPSFGEISPAELAQWVLDDKLKVRMQLQLHKILWDDAQGR